MAVVKESTYRGEGGANIGNLGKTHVDMADDLAALRAAIVGITAKLDADAGVTDTNYAATQNPPALKTTKA